MIIRDNSQNQTVPQSPNADSTHWDMAGCKQPNPQTEAAIGLTGT